MGWISFQYQINLEKYIKHRINNETSSKLVWDNLTSTCMYLESTSTLSMKSSDDDELCKIVTVPTVNA